MITPITHKPGSDALLWEDGVDGSGVCDSAGGTDRANVTIAVRVVSDLVIWNVIRRVPAW
jgi:hypothetical protein